MDMFIWLVLVNCYTIVISTDTYRCNTGPLFGTQYVSYFVDCFSTLCCILFNVE